MFIAKITTACNCFIAKLKCSVFVDTQHAVMQKDLSAVSWANHQQQADTHIDNMHKELRTCT